MCAVLLLDVAWRAGRSSAALKLVPTPSRVIVLAAERVRVNVRQRHAVGHQMGAVRVAQRVKARSLGKAESWRSANICFPARSKNYCTCFCRPASFVVWFWSSSISEPLRHLGRESQGINFLRSTNRSVPETCRHCREGHAAGQQMRRRRVTQGVEASALPQIHLQIREQGFAPGGGRTRQAESHD